MKLDRKVSAIEGNLSDNQYKLSKIDEKTAEFQKKFEAKIISDSMLECQDADIEKLRHCSRYRWLILMPEDMIIALSGFKDLAEKLTKCSCHSGCG
jgi:uncharacterized protein YxjI